MSGKVEMQKGAGYKKSDIGIIPTDWIPQKIGEIAHVATGTTPPTRDLNNYGEDFLFVGPGDLGLGKYVTNTEKKLSTKGYNLSRKYPLHTILYTCIGSTIGKAGIASVPLTSNQQINGIFPNDKYSTDYLFYSLCLIAPRIKALAGAQAVPLVNKSEFEETVVPFPPTLTEQTAIATALSDTDSLIQSLEKLIAKKRAIKQGAMQELLTGNKRLPGFEKEKGFQKTEVGEIPIDWQLKTFSELFNISGGYTASRDQLSDSGHCYLHYGDIHMSKKSYIDVKREFLDIPKLDVTLSKVSAKSLLSDGDIVFVDASEDDDGASKHIVVRNTDCIPYISGLHTIVVKSKTDEIDNTFKEFCFQTPYIKKQFYFYAVGTKVSGISKSNIAKILLAFPGTNEQKAIAQILSDMDSALTTLESKLSKYKTIKQGMMQELLTGKTRLNH